jgi:predicted heme/steroid binding protein
LRVEPGSAAPGGHYNYTINAELRPFNGTAGKDIYLAADGFVFNMSTHPTGPSFYGPGAGYGGFAGR